MNGNENSAMLEDENRLKSQAESTPRSRGRQDSTMADSFVPKTPVKYKSDSQVQPVAHQHTFNTFAQASASRMTPGFPFTSNEKPSLKSPIRFSTQTYTQKSSSSLPSIITSQADSTPSNMAESDAIKTPNQARARSRSQSRVPSSVPSRSRAVWTPKKRSWSLSPSPKHQGIGSPSRLLGSPELDSLRLAGEETSGLVAEEASQPLASDSLPSSPGRTSLPAVQEPRQSLTLLPKQLSLRERLALDKISRPGRELSSPHKPSRRMQSPVAAQNSYPSIPNPDIQPSRTQASAPEINEKENISSASTHQPSSTLPQSSLPQSSTPQKHQYPQFLIPHQKPAGPAQDPPHQNQSLSLVARQKQVVNSQKENALEKEKEIEVIELLSSSEDEALPPILEPPKKRRLVSRQKLSLSIPKPKSHVSNSDCNLESDSEEDDQVGDPDFKLRPRQTRSKSRQMAEIPGQKKRVSKEESSGFEGLLVPVEKNEGESPDQGETLGKRKRGKLTQTIPPRKAGESPKNRGTAGRGRSSASRAKELAEKQPKPTGTSDNICNLAELRRYNSNLLDIAEETRLAKSIKDVLHKTPKASRPQESTTSVGIKDESLNTPKTPKSEQTPAFDRSRRLKRPKRDCIKEIMERQGATTLKKAAHKGKSTGVHKPSPKRKRKAKMPLMEPKGSTGKVSIGKRKVMDVYDDFDSEQMESMEGPALDKMGDSSAKFKIFVDKWRYAKGDEYNFEAAEVNFERESANIVARVLRGSPNKNEKPNVAKKKNTGRMEQKVPTLAPSQIRDPTTPASFSSSSWRRQQLENMPPTFLKPLSNIVQITIGSDVFSIHQEILQWHCPILAEVCRASGGRLPPMMADVEVDVFGLFLYWLNGQAYRLQGKDLLLNSLGKPAYQQRLVRLWILASRLRMPKLQNDAIDMLETRRMSEHNEGQIQTKYFGYVYDNTVKGDGLWTYIIDTCLKSAFSKEAYDAFPKELQEDIFEATLVKLEKRDNGKDGEVDNLGMEKYHAVESNSR